MSQEGQLMDKKSLRMVLGNSANWNELAKDCIAFANATGGRLRIGIEDNDDEPHRLLALIEEDVGRYPLSRIGQIHERIGNEIPRSRIRRSMKQLVEEGRLEAEGVGSGTRYRLP